MVPEAPGPKHEGPENEVVERKRTSMHEGIAVWADCCSCEAEPRWAELAEELGIDLGDYEDEESEAP